ncbi:hypothetical protein ACQKFO_21440 [Rossellomorea sp. NPDC071047]|uniref:hypothetical protein n=1 Tax=Rossellomorea sp. NPDC071047 TaxID=3390675 RepID=UPI003CFE5797
MKEKMFLIQEVDESPKMLEVYLEQAWQSAFCFAFACEEPERQNQPPKILMTVLAGSDSTLQAMKAAMDIGSSGFRFGHGNKTLTSYEFESEFSVVADKGSYERFPITINQNKKALAIVHEKLMANEEYVLSFEGDPAEDVATLLGGGKYGLHILNEWKAIVYEELKRRNHIEEIELYYDAALFPKGLNLLKINLEEEQADNIISEMVRNEQLQFPKQGNGKALKEIESLADYMMGYSDDMVTKLSEEVVPTHNPIEDNTMPLFDTYPRQLFPVQSHVSTAVAKRLKEQKAVIIQGEMSVGKSIIMTAITDGYHEMIGKKGYFSCLMCPPSLTSKWPKEIKAIIPHAEVHVIKKTSQIIDWHINWVQNGRKKPTKPIFFIISFTTMRNDCRNVPAVQFDYKKTSVQREKGALPYRYGYYCPDCGESHKVIESTNVIINESGEEEEKVTKRTMDEDEFGTSRRIMNSTKPMNSFCSECGGNLWSKRVPTRYKSFSDWAQHEKKIIHALNQENKGLYHHLQENQKEFPKTVGMPRRIAAIEYIRRKMKNFFDFSIVDEVHECVTRCHINSRSMKLAV